MAKNNEIANKNASLISLDMKEVEDRICGQNFDHKCVSDEPQSPKRAFRNIIGC